MDDMIRQSHKWANMPTTRTIWTDKNGRVHLKSVDDSHQMGQPMRSGSKDEDNIAAQILVLKTTYAYAMTTAVTQFPERLMRFVIAIVDLLENLDYLQPLLLAASMASKTLTVFSKIRTLVKPFCHGSIEQEVWTRTTFQTIGHRCSPS